MTAGDRAPSRNDMPRWAGQSKDLMPSRYLVIGALRASRPLLIKPLAMQREHGMLTEKVGPSSDAMDRAQPTAAGPWGWAGRRFNSRRTFQQGVERGLQRGRDALEMLQIDFSSVFYT